MTDFKFYPWSVVWEITFACNMRCLHCGTSAGKKRPDELNTHEALQLIDELADLGADNITLSGGEPLLRERRARRRNLPHLPARAVRPGEQAQRPCPSNA